MQEDLKSTMQIGVVCYKYPLYEGGSYLSEQIEALCCQVQEVRLLATECPSGSKNSIENLKIRWIKLLKYRFFSDIFLNLKIFLDGLKFFREANLIYVVSFRGAFAAQFVGFFLKKPVVLSVELFNNPKSDLTSRIYFWLQRIVLSLNFKKIITWSDFHKKKLIEYGVAPERVEVIYPGIDVEKWGMNTAGSEIRNKYAKGGHLVVLAKPLFDYNAQMAEELIQIFKNFEGVQLLIGDGEKKKEVEKISQQIGMEDRVSFMPWVRSSELMNYWAASDIVVLPYKHEATISRSLLEVMALGKAVVTVNIGAISEVVEGKKNGILCNSREEMKEAIKKLIGDKELREELGVAAKQTIQEGFDVKKQIKKVVRLFENLI